MNTNVLNNNGNVSDQLQALAKQLHDEISDSARKGDTRTILNLTERLRRVDNLIGQHEAIRNEIGALTTLPSPASAPIRTHSQETNESHNEVRAHDETNKARGKRIRSKWLLDHGRTLARLRETIYRNLKGERIGITYSSGKKVMGGRKWWLGLPDGEFDGVALLCEQNDGSIRAVCLPRNFVEKHRNLLSKSSGGQEQFNIFEHAGKWTLGQEDVTQYVDNYSMIL